MYISKFIALRTPTNIDECTNTVIGITVMLINNMVISS